MMMMMMMAVMMMIMTMMMVVVVMVMLIQYTSTPIHPCTTGGVALCYRHSPYHATILRC